MSFQKNDYLQNYQAFDYKRASELQTFSQVNLFSKLI